jgi:hypothetical protein
MFLISVYPRSFAVPHPSTVTHLQEARHHKLGRTVDKPPMYERIEGRTNGYRLGVCRVPSASVIRPPVEVARIRQRGMPRVLTRHW